MKNKSAQKVKLTSYDDLFGTNEPVTGEKITSVPISLFHTFKDHPFRVVDDAKMQETVESIKHYGVLVPGIVRPHPDNGYEVVAGHRRWRACELAGLEEMPVIIRELDDDAATVIMVDTNIQREDILPSEKAKAYRMKYEAMKHQGSKGDKFTADAVGEAAGDSGRTVQRYIRLTELVPELLDYMDAGKIPMIVGEKLSYLKKEEQAWLVDGMKACQNASNGMWLNNMNANQSSSNPYETSGTALVCYAVMKAINEGWLDDSYADMAILAFDGICNEKLNGTNLTDICFKGAPGSSNSTFYDNEGKGVGPFIMFYAEMLEYVDEQDDAESDTPVVPEKPEVPEVTVEDTTIKVENVTDLVGTVVTNEDKAVIEEKEYTNFVAYDITATLVDGIKAIVSIPVPAEWNATEDELVGISVEDGEVKEIEGTLSEDGIYSFEVEHFSAKGVAYSAKAIDGNEWNALPSGHKYVLDVNGVEAGADNKYIVVGSNNDIGETGGNFGNTVYDYGFAETIKAINSLQGSAYDTNRRETHVIFMTDGAPSNYNGGYYTTGRSENLKVDADEVFDNKGNNNEDTWYNYICSQEHTYARQVYDKVNGKFSTVGFDLVHGGFGDKQWSEAELTAFLEKIVRDENNNGLNPVVAATNEAQLAQFYREAANAIKAAGSQGRVTDIVDGDFTLQMATQTGLTTGEPQTLKNPPKITVTKYELWTAKDTDDLALIGKRKVDDEGNPIKEVLETVTFNAAGTEAYSNRVEHGTKNILSTANDGTVTIKAQTFTYKKDTEGVETFDWFIETISEKEVVLEFDAYLKGAMEGDAPKGTYYTNKEATLEYIDVNGKYVNRLFPVPVVNWGGATTTVRYYLVNHEGKPVNRAGQVVPDAARIYIGNPVTVPLNLNADLSINSSPIDAVANVPTGYFLYDENATFSVKTTSSTEGITGGIVVSEPSADAFKTTGTGESAKTQTGAQTTIVTDYEPGYYTYSTVIFGVRWDLTKEKISPLENDKIVLDYGKAIQEDVLVNDVEELKQISSDRKATYNAQLVGFAKYNANTKLDEIMVSAGAGTLEGKNGNFSIVDGKVQYQLTKMLSEVEKVFCVVKLSNTVNKDDYFYMYEELDIIPATSVYYENDFADFITYTDGGSKWGETNETAGRDNLQNDGTVGTNEAYGYDTSYADDTKYSNGTAVAISTSTDSKVDGYNKTYATFTFTGTGFDLISTTSQKSGMIRAEIYAGDTIEEGEKFIKYAQVANVGASTLYQIPVISYEGLEHGTYTVKLHVYNSYENTTTPELSRGGMFHFDALRIYDPINVDGTLVKGSDAEIAKAAYVVDEEAYNKHFEVREAIISAADFESTTEGAEVVYIDASASSNIIANPEATVQDYEADGPNNETYLINDSAVIGFILEVDKIPKSLQIGAKSVLGNDVMMEMYIENPEDPDAYATMINPENGFNHASAQNYSTFVDDSDENEVIDFTPYFAEQEDGTYQTYVYISKIHADDETDNSILSITDFKATFVEESGMRATYNSGLVNAYNLRNTAEKDEIVTSDVELYSAAFTTTSVRYTKQAVLEVETSVSVEELVLVNEKGKVMTAATTVETSEDGNKVWTLKFKPGNVGVRTFTVYGVAEDGCETERATVSIEATKR